MAISTVYVVRIESFAGWEELEKELYDKITVIEDLDLMETYEGSIDEDDDEIAERYGYQVLDDEDEELDECGSACGELDECGTAPIVESEESEEKCEKCEKCGKEECECEKASEIEERLNEQMKSDYQKELDAISDFLF